MLERVPIVSCHDLTALRIVHRLFPSARIARRFLPRRCRQTAGTLLEVPAGAMRLTYPGEWILNPLHDVLILGDRMLAPEIAVLGEALRSTAPGGEGVVLDVGGNVGYFALSMRAFTTLPIISFEPNPFVCEINRINLRRNAARYPNIEAVMVACSDTPMELSLRCGFNSAIEARGKDDIPYEECAELMPERLTELMNSGRVVARIQCVRLDDHVEPSRRVRFMKIDVEGFELRVLRGADRILRTDRPGLFIELHPAMLRRNDSSMGEVIAHLADLGYGFSYHLFSPPRAHGFARRLSQRYFAPTPRRFDSLGVALSNLPRNAEQLHVEALPLR